MQIEAEAPPRRGRPSRHPVTIRYCENAEVHALMQDAAERQGLSFSEVQRLVNRAGLQALSVVPA